MDLVARRGSSQKGGGRFDDGSLCPTLCRSGPDADGPNPGRAGFSHSSRALPDDTALAASRQPDPAAAPIRPRLCGLCVPQGFAARDTPLRTAEKTHGRGFGAPDSGRPPPPPPGLNRRIVDTSLLKGLPGEALRAAKSGYAMAECPPRHGRAARPGTPRGRRRLDARAEAGIAARAAEGGGMVPVAACRES